MGEQAVQPDTAGHPVRPDVAEEEPIKLRKRPPEDSEIDITPMIDCTFLLLIFFLVTSNPGENSELKLPFALHGTGVSTRTSLVITVIDSQEDLARVYLADGADDANLLRGTVKEQEDRIVDYVRKGLEGSPRKSQVILKASKGIPSREIKRVAIAVGKAGEAKLHTAVLENE